MTIEKQVIHFSEYMQALRAELRNAVACSYTCAGVTLNAKSCTIDVMYSVADETFYVEMINTTTTPSEYRTVDIYAPRHIIEKMPMHRFATDLLRQFSIEMRHRIESSFVKKTIEAQDLSPIGERVAAVFDPQALYTTRLVVNTPKAWGGQGYGILKLRVMTAGKDELIYGLIGEVQECYSDGTCGLPVSLPFIETNADGIANILHTTHEWAALLRGDK